MTRPYEELVEEGRRAVAERDAVIVAGYGPLFRQVEIKFGVAALRRFAEEVTDDYDEARDLYVRMRRLAPELPWPTCGAATASGFPCRQRVRASGRRCRRHASGG